MQIKRNQLEHENIKTCEAFDSYLNKLKELNAEKMADEKHVKTREKKLSKKIRALEEEKSRFEHKNNNNASKDNKYSQTESHLDIPY